jgi:2-methylcitrate dehydratase PrpD
LIAGRVTEQEYRTEMLGEPRVKQLSERIDTVPTDGIREDEAIVSISLNDGRILRHHVEHAVGSAQRPMSDTDIERKFSELGEPYLPADRIGEVIDACWNLDQLDDAGAASRLCARREHA